MEEMMQPSLPSSMMQKDFTDNDQAIVDYLDGQWNGSGDYYAYTDPNTELVLNFYNGQIPEKFRFITHPTTGEAIETHYSTARIGWTKRAITQMRDDIVGALISGDEFVTIAPTIGSENAIAVCERLVTVLLHNAGLFTFLDQAVLTWLLFGEVGMYVDWADAAAYCLALQMVPYKDIRHLPVYKQPDKATLSFVQYCTKYELLNTPEGMFYNVDLLDEPTGNQLPRSDGSGEEDSGGDTFLVVTSYVPEMTIDGQTYINSVVVIADREHLIHFETGLTHEAFLARPHIRACREHFVDVRHGPVQIGQSVAHQAIDLELAGFVIHNLMLDNAKQTVHPPRGIDPQDTSFKKYLDANPATAMLPGALVPLVSSNPLHLQPIIGKDNLLQSGMAVIQRLEQQYLMTVGIPDFGGGVASDDQRVAATTRSIQANRAAVRMKAMVQDANRQIVMPIIYRAYHLVSQAYNAGDLHDLAEQVCPTEHLLAQGNGEIAPELKMERFKMAVYESPAARSERIQAVQQLMSTLPTLVQAYPTLLQEAGIEIPRLVRQLMRDLGIEATMPVTPQALQQPPMTETGMSDGNGQMEAEPPEPVSDSVAGAGALNTGLPQGLPIPDSF